MKLNNFSAVIPTKNRTTSLLKTLKSISKQSVMPSQIIIIDQSNLNAFNDIFSYFSNDDFLNLINYQYKPNISGLVEAKDYGMHMVDDELICFLEDDLYLHKNFFKSLLTSFHIKKDLIGVCGVITNHPESTLFYKILFKIFHLGFLKDNRIDIYDKIFLLSNKNKLIYSDKLSGGISMWKIDKIKSVGFDLINNLHFTEDIDLSTRVISKYGRRTFINTSAHVRHDTVDIGRVNISNKMYLKVREYKIFYKKRKSFINLLMISWLFLGFLTESIYLSVKHITLKPFLFFIKGLYA